jgi:hypothetical protein
MPEESRYRTTGPAVVSDTVDNETIIVSLDTGRYYDLNHVGAAIWVPLVRGTPPTEIVADLVGRFGADPAVAEGDVAGLIATLVGEGLIVESDGAAPPAYSLNGGAPDGGVQDGLPYEAPIINKHDDMQQLLLLDPIHEVDEAGWPSRL